MNTPMIKVASPMTDVMTSMVLQLIFNPPKMTSNSPVWAWTVDALQSTKEQPAHELMPPAAPCRS